MRTITFEEIEGKISEIVEMNEKSVLKLYEKMVQEQPALTTFLLSIPEDFSEEGAELFTELGIAIYLAIKGAVDNFPEVTMKTIEEARDENFKIIDSMENLSEEEFFEKSKKFVDEYPQPEILELIASYLFETENNIDDDEKGAIFTQLIIFTDSIIKEIDLTERK